MASSDSLLANEEEAIVHAIRVEASFRDFYFRGDRKAQVVHAFNALQADLARSVKR